MMEVDGVYYAQAASYIGAALAIGIGVLGPAIGQALISAKSVETVGKYPESYNKIFTLTLMSLGIIEFTAIMCFLIAAKMVF